MQLDEWEFKVVVLYYSLFGIINMVGWQRFGSAFLKCGQKMLEYTFTIICLIYGIEEL